jgi:hypothetical protein
MRRLVADRIRVADQSAPRASTPPTLVHSLKAASTDGSGLTLLNNKESFMPEPRGVHATGAAAKRALKFYQEMTKRFSLFSGRRWLRSVDNWLKWGRFLVLCF